MIFDAHTHLFDGKLLRHKDYFQIVSASTPAECRLVEQFRREDSQLYFACGVHPLQSDSVSVSALNPWFWDVCAIGEIGMDTVWCSVDPLVQLRMFRAQLSLAEALHKPIILHTKGCEKTVLQEIQWFPFPILVHWYSCDKYLDDYINKDCYFTIGPDLLTNPSVERVASTVPLHRLLVESDGVEGATWARKCSFTGEELLSLLQEQIITIARLRGIPVPVLERILLQNGLRFVSASVSSEKLQ